MEQTQEQPQEQSELKICMTEIDSLLQAHATEQTEVIAAHSILPILKVALEHLYALRLEVADHDEADDNDEYEEPQFVYISVPLWARLSQFLGECWSSEVLHELAPELHRESIFLAAELQAQIERRPVSEILMELTPEVNPELLEQIKAQQVRSALEQRSKEQRSKEAKEG